MVRRSVRPHFQNTLPERLRSGHLCASGESAAWKMSRLNCVQLAQDRVQRLDTLSQTRCHSTQLGTSRYAMQIYGIHTRYPVIWSTCLQGRMSSRDQGDSSSIEKRSSRSLLKPVARVPLQGSSSCASRSRILLRCVCSGGTARNGSRLRRWVQRPSSLPGSRGTIAITCLGKVKEQKPHAIPPCVMAGDLVTSNLSQSQYRCCVCSINDRIQWVSGMGGSS
jgi:hypothetical protein